MDRSLNYGRDVVREFLHLSMPYSVVLDLGPGRGYDLRAAGELVPDARLCGIDATHGAGDQIAAAQLGGADIAVGDIERDRYPFADESVDVVIANQILEHTKELFWISHEVTRVLRPGGHWIIGVPNLASAHNRLLLAFGRQPTCIRSYSAHVRGFTRRDLLGFLSAGFPGGYECRKVAGANFYPLPAAIAGPMGRALPGLAVTFFVLLRKVRPYTGEFLMAPAREALETPFYVGA